jgi:phytanoyl-CoA hydroxylase
MNERQRAWRAAFDRDGFVVVPDLVPVARCDRLRARAAELVDSIDVDERLSVFTTNEQARTSGDHFLESGGVITAFFEEEALAADGTLLVEKERAYNKLGHAMHDLDAVFDEFSRAPEVRELATALVDDPVLLQSMYIFKHPGIGGEVTLHQDATFLRTEPPSVVGLWFALEDATIENGCLWALPGGHHDFPVHRFFRRAAGGGTEFTGDEESIPHADEVALEVRAGTVIALHGALPHRSDANRSPKSRHAYTLHVIERGLPYPADNWLQRPGLPVRGFD